MQIQPYTRREFLRGSLGALALSPLLSSLPTLAAQNPPSSAEASSSPQKILILGAGMSGLTAALALHRRGHDVTVIEYQPRVGGRLLSIPLADAQFSEAGGGHFRSNMPYALGYIHRFGLPLLALNDGLPRYYIEGKSADGAVLDDWPWDLHENERNVTVSSMLNSYLVKYGLDADTVLDSDWPDQATASRFDNMSLADAINAVGGSPAFLKVLEAHAGAFTTAAPALNIFPRLAYHFGDQNLFRIDGGNERLPQAMAAALGSRRIVMDAPVVAIDQTGSQVSVKVKDGRQLQGDRLISTVPFTVLPDIRVTPSWSTRKVAMFEGFRWSNSVKVIVQTKSPTWLAKGIHGWPMAGSDRPWERVIDITGNEHGGRGNLFFYLNGPNALSYLQRPREGRGREIVEMFQSDLPGLIDDVIDIKEFAWSEQPWIRASFGGPPLGGAWMIQEWTKPEGRIHFAGDFTTLKTGWVEGAIESGLRAARQIDPLAQPEVEPGVRQESRSLRS